jgi:hypothetical protein
MDDDLIARERKIISAIREQFQSLPKSQRRMLLKGIKRWRDDPARPTGSGLQLALINQTIDSEDDWGDQARFVTGAWGMDLLVRALGDEATENTVKKR